ncbi:hypothetical protein [Ruania alba]|uniref:Uncharacterized protein n=1 Tax=Ruania alba TaxID=648782 RepID=A0A1H5K9L3_9MICO|nr:hypothetical protein [Ruania alba]SEE61502.1 hypothetical protein SAMN04488554_2155 [Ruania alba]
MSLDLLTQVDCCGAVDLEVDGTATPGTCPSADERTDVGLTLAAPGPPFGDHSSPRSLDPHLSDHLEHL